MARAGPRHRPASGAATASSGAQRQGVAQGTEGSRRDQAAPVGQPAAHWPGYGLGQRVPGHDQARDRHRGMPGRHQQQGDADHALRQPRADVGECEPTGPRLGEQPPVRRCGPGQLNFVRGAHGQRTRSAAGQLPVIGCTLSQHPDLRLAKGLTPAAFLLA